MDEDKWNLHKWRKTGATLLYKNNVPVPVISRILGHESMLVTQLYLDVQDTAPAPMVDVVSNGFLMGWA